MSRISAFVLAVALFAFLRSAFSMPVTPESAFEKRESGRGTWFDVGLGACGKTSKNNDKIVAISSSIYNGGSHCNKGVTITANGKTEHATVLDECPSCSSGSLDMSPSLFEEFAPLSKGVLSITWNFD